MKATTIKLVLSRFAKTAVQAFVSVILLAGFGNIDVALIVSAAAAAISAGMNAVGVTPYSTAGRALSTFLQTFVAAWAATGYQPSKAALWGAGAAAIAALWNFTKKTM